MSEVLFFIRPYQDENRDQLLQVWEKSVLATHHFLSKEDFEAIREMVNHINFQEFSVFCLLDDTEQILGFLALRGIKLEMLFLDPKWFGRGLGKILLDFARDSCGCLELDVNEQNLFARIFYEKAGFEIIGRSEKDGAGMDYPILQMRLR